jgi:hypothetical protein
MQTSISATGQPIGVAGQRIDDGPGDITSGFSEETVLEIPFGCGIVAGVADDGVKLPSGAGDTPVGINEWTPDHQVAGVNDPTGAPTGDLGSTGLKPKASIAKSRKGRFLVPLDAGTVVVPNVSRPFLRFRTDGGVNVQPGTWAIAQDGGVNLIDCTRLGVFVSSAFTAPNATGGSALVAILECDFTSRNS